MGLLLLFIDWTEKIFVPLGNFGLFLLAFSEASFNPIPIETMLIPLALKFPDKALIFSLIVTVGSVLGALLGYAIGYVGKVAILDRFFSKSKVAKVHRLFEKHGFLAVFVGGFTPLPFKLFTIAAGAFYIDIKKFILAAVLSRGLRFLIEGLLIMYFGQKVLAFLDKHFDLWTLLITLGLIVIYFVYRRIKKRRKIIVH